MKPSPSASRSCHGIAVGQDSVGTGAYGEDHIPLNPVIFIGIYPLYSMYEDCHQMSQMTLKNHFLTIFGFNFGLVNLVLLFFPLRRPSS